MNIQLVAIDIDGTLLNDQYQITKRTKQTIQEAMAQGIKVVLASGRGPTSCLPIVQELGIEGELIGHNGAVLLHCGEQRVIHELGFEAQDMTQILTYCREQKIHFDVNTALEMYVEKIPDHAAAMYHTFFMSPHIVENVTHLEMALVKLTLFGEETILDAAEHEVPSLLPGYRMIRSGETFIDFMHAEVNKAYGLQQVMAMYQLKPNKVMAIGNYYNDLDMLKLAGIGVAMGNSPAEVKKQADCVTATNNEDGVAIILEKVLNNHSFMM
jgi:Cof subfamily protein (haloacid dehalogenase superfamily)